MGRRISHSTCGRLDNRKLDDAAMSTYYVNKPACSKSCSVINGLDDVVRVIMFAETASCIDSVPMEKPSSREVLLCVPL